ncbi:MAG TPA: SDR family NAD(P)-dependent oxidoreductase, partial [Acidobacteriaceae bacterium]|nr:SDR family NAD(P)-dependent oxidoreductase [Acidobacteriaceae bacterium]
MSELGGRAALVTGTTGIGRAIALRLAEGGAQVMACGIDSAANDALHAEASRRNMTFATEPCDVSVPEQVARVVDSTVQRFGGIDILVNAAAIHP